MDPRIRIRIHTKMSWIRYTGCLAGRTSRGDDRRRGRRLLHPTGQHGRNSWGYFPWNKKLRRSHFLLSLELAPSAFPSTGTATVATILSFLSLSALCVTEEAVLPILPGGWMVELLTTANKMVHVTYFCSLWAVFRIQIHWFRIRIQQF